MKCPPTDPIGSSQPNKAGTAPIDNTDPGAPPSLITPEEAWRLGREAASKGHCASHAEVSKWLRRWGEPDPGPAPRPWLAKVRVPLDMDRDRGAPPSSMTPEESLRRGREESAAGLGATHAEVSKWLRRWTEPDPGPPPRPWLNDG